MTIGAVTGFNLIEQLVIITEFIPLLIPTCASYAVGTVYDKTLI